MESFVGSLEAVTSAVPSLLEAFNIILSGIEHVILRLALLWFTLYGIYRALKSH